MFCSEKADAEFVKRWRDFIETSPESHRNPVNPTYLCQLPFSWIMRLSHAFFFLFTKLWHNELGSEDGTYWKEFMTVIIMSIKKSIRSDGSTLLTGLHPQIIPFKCLSTVKMILFTSGDVKAIRNTIIKVRFGLLFVYEQFRIEVSCLIDCWFLSVFFCI